MCFSPEFSFRYFLGSRGKEINLVETFSFTHCHDFFFEMFHEFIRGSVFSPRLIVTCLSHIIFFLCFIGSYAVDYNMRMDVSRMVFPIRMGDYEHLMAWEDFFSYF